MTFFKSLSSLALGAALLSSTAFAGEIVLNSDHSDPTPKKAMEELIADFQKANPDITVKWNNFDHEGYKTSIRNFLTADPPDIVTWYAGNRMEPFVKAGLFEDVSDVWDANGLNDQLKSASASMTIDGKKWGVPYTYYQWGIYYNKDMFAAAGITEDIGELPGGGHFGRGPDGKLNGLVYEEAAILKTIKPGMPKITPAIAIGAVNKFMAACSAAGSSASSDDSPWPFRPVMRNWLPSAD